MPGSGIPRCWIVRQSQQPEVLDEIVAAWDATHIRWRSARCGPSWRSSRFPSRLPWFPPAPTGAPAVAVARHRSVAGL